MKLVAVCFVVAFFTLNGYGAGRKNFLNAALDQVADTTKQVSDAVTKPERNYGKTAGSRTQRAVRQEVPVTVVVAKPTPVKEYDAAKLKCEGNVKQKKTSSRNSRGNSRR